uniref:DNA-directed RNA polymerase n=1 Tax=viral metagenome TaxID=1070528 RepID=A0A6C0IMP8_9ZZZZ
MENEQIWKVVHKYFEDNPQNLVTHHIESYNDFFKNGIFQIFKEKNPVEILTAYDNEIEDYRYKCIMYFGGKEGNKIYFGKPIVYDSDENIHYMYPNEARLRNMTYGMTIHYDIDIEFVSILDNGEEPDLVFDQDTIGGAKKGHIDVSQFSVNETAKMMQKTNESIIGKNIQKREVTIDKIYLGKFPIMLQSDFCILKGLPKSTRSNMGECKNDLGGYFIIDGKEKTVVSQEKFGDNVLYIRKYEKEVEPTYLCSAEIKSVSENVSKPRRTLTVAVVPPNSKYTNLQIVVKIPQVRDDIPLFILFRALGIISDKKIIEYCLLDTEKYEDFVDLFHPSVQDGHFINTQQDALFYIGTLIKGKTIYHAQEILADYFFPHIGETNYNEKAHFLGYMVFEMLKVYRNVQAPTDRDHMKYKRIELVGSLMYDLFRDYFTIQQRKIQQDLEEKVWFSKNIYVKNLYGLIMQNRPVFNQKIVEEGFRKAMKGNWGAKEHTKKVGIVQDLNRLSFNSALSHLRKTNLPMDASLKIVGPRLLHCSQWGFTDPIDTPDGGNIGLHKHLSISTYISQPYSRTIIIEWLKENVGLKSISDYPIPVIAKKIKVFVNGYWCGLIEEPGETIDKIKLFRRNGLIPVYTSVSFEIKSKSIFIFTDGGRACRPIFYYDNNNKSFSYENEEFLELLEKNELKWNQMITGWNDKKISNYAKSNKIYQLQQLYNDINDTNPAKYEKFISKKAVIDYIDSSESEHALIALNKEQLLQKKEFTHMEIHPSLIFGVMCNQINFPENNPGTRNSFSCGQSKQACSLYHSNYQTRLDKTGIVLNYGQSPLVRSRYSEYINNNENSYGENTIVAIMCYTGYNVEDAILINEGALKRGLFKTTYYSCYETHEEKEKQNDVVKNKVIKNIENDESVVKLKQGFDYSKLNKHGLIKEETEVDDKTIIIGMAMDNGNEQNISSDMSIGPKKGQRGIIDKAFITEGEEGTRIAKVRIRENRTPAIGDKLASRAGQKGTIGMVIPEIDMPFTKDGLKPDLIINPHALPTRMTIGQLVECLVGKASLNLGCFGDCTAFANEGSKIGVYGNLLTELGFHSSGNEVLYNGMTGEQLESDVFIGPNYYMRLKHMVKDKINYRSLGPKTSLTKQPVGGRANDGGLRIGEMERDSLISHGASEFLRESMNERADKYHIAVCNSTGLMCLYNPDKNLFMSPLLDGPIKFLNSVDNNLNLQNVTKYGRSFSIISVPYSFKLLMQELMSVNVQMRIITDENIDQIEHMTNSLNIPTLLKSKKTSKEIVNDINKALRNKQPMIDMKKEEPVEESLEYHPDPSPRTPEYLPGTPEYLPGTPEYLPGTPDYLPGTPQTPPFPPDLNSIDTPITDIEKSISPMRGQFVDSLDSDDGSIPPPPQTTPPFLSQEQTGGSLIDMASKFNIGDSVVSLLDSKRTREWNITKINPPFIHIETSDADNLKIPDMVKIVTGGDIQKKGDFMQYMAPTSTDGGGYSQQYAPSQGNDNQQMPNIVVKPIIKIMNGGNDYSAGEEQDAPNDIVQDVSEPIIVRNNTQPISGGSNEQNDPMKPATNTNFDKLVIKKLE